MSPRDASQQSLVSIVDPAALAPELQELRAFWDAKRGRRAMPDRGEIDPFELRSHLPFIGLVEALPGGADFRYRLLGTAITERFGRNSTGRTVSDVYGGGESDIFTWVMGMYRQTFDARRPVLGQGTLRAVGKDFLQFDVLNLPFAGDDGAVAMILSRARFLEPPITVA